MEQLPLQPEAAIHLHLQTKPCPPLTYHWTTDETWLAATAFGIEFTWNTLVQKNLLHGKIKVLY